MHFSDYDTRLAAYAAVIDGEDRLLLTWWNGEGRGVPGLSMPGGGVEYHESLVEAVEREVLEETGYAVRVGAPIAAHSLTNPDGGRNGRPYKSVDVAPVGTARSGLKMGVRLPVDVVALWSREAGS